jgi:hypothetical protein
LHDGEILLTARYPTHHMHPLFQNLTAPEPSIYRASCSQASGRVHTQNPDRIQNRTRYIRRSPNLCLSSTTPLIASESGNIFHLSFVPKFHLFFLLSTGHHNRCGLPSFSPSVCPRISDTCITQSHLCSFSSFAHTALNLSKNIKLSVLLRLSSKSSLTTLRNQAPFPFVLP